MKFMLIGEDKLEGLNDELFRKGLCDAKSQAENPMAGRLLSRTVGELMTNVDEKSWMYGYIIGQIYEVGSIDDSGNNFAVAITTSGYLEGLVRAMLILAQNGSLERIMDDDGINLSSFAHEMFTTGAFDTMLGCGEE